MVLLPVGQPLELTLVPQRRMGPSMQCDVVAMVLLPVGQPLELTLESRRWEGEGTPYEI